MTKFLKGDATAAITLALAEGFDYSGKTVHLEYQGARRSFSGVAAGGSLTFSFTAAETAPMSLGAFPVRVWLEDESGGTTTIRNADAKLCVTDSAADVHPGGAIYLDVRGGLYGLDSLPDRWNENDLRTKINEIIRRLGGTVALLLACALPAFCAGPLTVQTAPKGEVYNDAQIVTNVDFDVSALAAKADTTNTYTKAETDAAIVRLAPAPGNYAAVSNAAMNAAQNATNLVAAATNGIPRITESEDHEGWAANAERAEMADEAEYSTVAQSADEAEYAWILSDGNDKRNATDIFSQLDAATATNAAQQAALAGKASTNDVALTPVYGGNGERFSDWTFSNSGNYTITGPVQMSPDPSSEWIYVLHYHGATWPPVETFASEELARAATTQTYFGIVIANRTENPVIGYTLGSQTDKVLASTNDFVKSQTLTNYYTIAETDDAIDALAAYYITTSNGQAFASYAALTNATVYYSGGEPRTPTRNDYAVVLADETHGTNEWRYIYTVSVVGGVTNKQWEAQYPIETNDYEALSNKPSINGLELSGNKTAADLGLATPQDVASATNALDVSLSSRLSQVSRDSTNYTDTAIATADTSYRHFATLTNLNQTVQYVTTAPGGTLSIQLPTGDDATKDWIVYAYFGAETPLVLPPAIWWMADEAYTNAIPSDVPTALYFSQVADGIFTLSRQELKSVEIVTP